MITGNPGIDAPVAIIIGALIGVAVVCAFIAGIIAGRKWK